MSTTIEAGIRETEETLAAEREEWYRVSAGVRSVLEGAT